MSILHLIAVDKQKKRKKSLAASKVYTSKTVQALLGVKLTPLKYIHAKVIAFFPFLCLFSDLHLPITTSIQAVLQIVEDLNVQKWKKKKKKQEEE